MVTSYKNFKTGRRVQIMLNSNPAVRGYQSLILPLKLAEVGRNPDF